MSKNKAPATVIAYQTPNEITPVIDKVPNTADKCFTRHKPAVSVNLIVLTVTMLCPQFRLLSENDTSGLSEYHLMIRNELRVIFGYQSVKKPEIPIRLLVL